jgi:cysteine sulfinate desulfinase/cysteine desulfurase-like protein
MTRPVIYMDNHATTQVDPRVLEAMLPYFTERYGNAASRNHHYGWEAEAAVEDAREQVARLINARRQDIIFTSGATESDNLAIKGAAEFYRDKGNHIITVVTEHKAVLDSCTVLQRAGRARVTVLPVDRYGCVDPEDVRRAMTDDTILISVMHANNEIGTLQPVRDIGRLAKERGVLFHCDAAQSAGKVPLDVEAMGIDLLSFSAHKMYGPKGCGALYVRSRGPRVRLSALIDGGGHERGLRSGTLNVPGIVGFGKACALCASEMGAENDRVARLRDPGREPEPQLRLRRGGVFAHGPGRRCRVFRFRLHVGHAGAFVCSPGHRCGRRIVAHLAALRSRPLQHFRRGRAGHRSGGRGSDTATGVVATVRGSAEAGGGCRGERRRWCSPIAPLRATSHSGILRRYRRK